MSALSRIIIGCLLITLVVLVSERSRTLAGILSTAPINVPIILWIIWGNSAGNYADMQTVSRSMLTGIFSTACFIAVCWIGFSRRWPFGMIVVAGYLVWALIVFGPGLMQRAVDRISR